MVELDKKNIEHKLFSSDFTFEDSSVFKELMTLYPWCSSFTVVYLKSLSNTDDMRFPNELEEYAVQLNTREVIYDLIYGVDSKESVNPPSKALVSNKGEKEEIVLNTELSEKPEDQQSNDELEKMIVSTEKSLVPEISESNSQINDEDVKNTSNPTGDVDDVILNVIRNSSNPDGVPYDSIVLACVEAGFSRESSEDAIEDLRDIKCEIIEPRFGFFQILD